MSSSNLLRVLWPHSPSTVVPPLWEMGVSF
ncbi:Uncharacterised protein [Vibrio cholerae]|nr:Uncharacterised protein [Vibrio cholerae]